MKILMGSVLLLSALLLGGCGGEESSGSAVAAPAPGTEVPTQTTTVVVPLPAEGVTDTAAPAGATPANAETNTAPEG